MKRFGIILVALFGLFQHCSEPIEIESIGFDDILVIEGLITDQLGPQQIKVTRTAPVNTDSLTGEVGAEVFVVDGNESRIDFAEVSSGIYQSVNPFAATVGNTYQLFVNTNDGRSYASTEVEMQATPPIDSVYATFTPTPTALNDRGGNINVFVDALNNDVGAEFFRWTWKSAFELRVPNPSRFEWLGGNDFRIREVGSEGDSLQVERCWNNDSLSQITLATETVPGRGVEQIALTGFHTDTRAMRIEYGIEVKQYALSRSSYDYWQLIAESTQGSGFLFDRQVGTIPGNIQNVNDRDEVVLGIFEASQEVSVIRQWRPEDFRDDGFQRRTLFWNDCFDIEPVILGTDSIGFFMEQNFPAWEIAFFTTTPSAVYFFPSRCSNCTQFGDNNPPEFWEE